MFEFLGAVYQDLGNLCFTFLSDKKNVEINNQILINALKEFNIFATPSGRNDITVNERKISGSAFKLNGNRALHHGTMLMSVDMTSMQSYLNPNKKKLESKGIKSVVSRVINLQDLNKDVNFDNLGDKITQSFFNHYQTTSPIEIISENVKEHVKEDFYELSSENWKFGIQTPQFSHQFETRFDWGILDVHINSKDGKIDQVVIYSDTLFPDLIQELTQNLTGVDYSFKGISQAISKTKLKLPELSTQLDETEKWMKESL